MNPSDFATPAWMAPALEQVDAARRWTAHLNPAQDAAVEMISKNAAAELTALQNAAGMASVQTAAAELAAVQNVAADFASVQAAAAELSALSTVSDPMMESARRVATGFLPPDARDMSAKIHGLIPDAAWKVHSAVPEASRAVYGYGATPDVSFQVTGPVPDWMKGATGVAGDFTEVTSGVSLDDYQRSLSFKAAGIAQRSPAYGGTFTPSTATPLVEPVTGTAQAPVTPRPRVERTGEIASLVEQVARLVEQNEVLAAKLDEQSTGSSFPREILASLLATIIWLVIQQILLIKFGIVLTPTEPKKP